MSIRIECDNCNTDLDTGAEVYCESCYGVLDKEIADLKELIADREAEIKDLDFKLAVAEKRG